MVAPSVNAALVTVIVIRVASSEADFSGVVARQEVRTVAVAMRQQSKRTIFQSSNCDGHDTTLILLCKKKQCNGMMMNKMMP